MEPPLPDGCICAGCTHAGTRRGRSPTVAGTGTVRSAPAGPVPITSPPAAGALPALGAGASPAVTVTITSPATPSPTTTTTTTAAAAAAVAAERICALAIAAGQRRVPHARAAPFRAGYTRPGIGHYRTRGATLSTGGGTCT
ncbi:hypothetical protein FIBSPDRAFT_447733 [Athelia psychrophila]|uniref:Uncharacterized protein n=1 Tax=Athelia psychrophila TaxID=1759441 RepID=A0A166MCC3_9AGAM|nr:hypothetical protein FIBSPDRAFT_447733 [Fibularhizoctonia sp. CBS 109695]